MKQGLFIIGTDTGVGKTVLAAAVTAALRRRGVDATYMKPVGSDGVAVAGRLVSPDALFAARAAGLTDPYELLNPVCLPGALSPLAASEASGIPVDLAPVGPAFAELGRRHAFVVVEGVGGLLAPVTAAETAEILNRISPLPALVVGRPGLGTINHTLLTLEALERRGIACVGFCYAAQAPTDDDPSLPTNARHTRLFTSAPFWGTLPYLPGLDPDRPDPQALASAGEALAELLDLATGGFGGLAPRGPER